jgi:DNA invertase Pin-like site-specific DNA recombinase
VIPVRYVTYKRVSSKEQGRSGLGLDAQARDIRLFLENYSETPYEVLQEFVEVQSGTDDSRPQLVAAIALAKKECAVLVVAKLDRLSRRVSFISSLMEDVDLEFKVAALPTADKFSLHIYAALAEQERTFISQRTRSALAAAKARGIRLGAPSYHLDSLARSRSAAALKAAQKVEGIILPLRKQGSTLKQICDVLNSSGIKTRTGKSFAPMQVSRMIKHLELAA